MRAEEAAEQEVREDARARSAREMIELLQELRVVLPGVQVLFAFLLTVPFAEGFDEVGPLQQKIFFGTLICTALSAGLLIAPSAHHGILWHKQAREPRLQAANRLAIAGMVLLVPAMVGVVFMVTDIIFDSVLAALATTAVSAFFVYVWFVLPLRYRSDRH
ncbi:MAG: DUF6328 family protein [Actinomycetota bacterium]|nr:DUF6328 family protein [Actinomycetota bacterium]MDP9484594.1 DUF6328 family protein [Actinomycetota bacterium]PLS82119.1 MAG: hypothetical protein CYG60_25235 [Actinomycetota bacterium]